ncbi:NAD(P)-dependent oxidoreductase [bacterium]|nr:NAD(P)-dependent oxidoreductase [bacterium]
MEIAFLGMGLMGAPMAANCIKAGHDVVVYNRTPEKNEPLVKLGARAAATPAEAVRGRRMTLICVEASEDVEQVIFGENGIVHGMPQSGEPPFVVVDHSTISPIATEEFAKRLKNDFGALYLDAPVSGGTVGAQQGTLTVMCGGPLEAFERARPVLEAMATSITHIGTRNGDGQKAKIINQVVVAINCLATDEAVRLGQALGLDMDKVLSAITKGAAGSWSLQNLGPRWLAGDFEPGFRLRHLLKDLGYCSESIDHLEDKNAEYPAIWLALGIVARAVQAGYGDENIHAMEKIFE